MRERDTEVSWKTLANKQTQHMVPSEIIDLNQEFLLLAETFYLFLGKGKLLGKLQDV